MYIYTVVLAELELDGESGVVNCRLPLPERCRKEGSGVGKGKKPWRR